MKTFIFGTSYKYYNRQNAWLEYYNSIKHRFGASSLFLFDDGSPERELKENINAEVFDFDDLPGQEHEVQVIRFPDNLGRPAHTCYPGWWRSFLFSAVIAEKFGFEKIIHIETDAFILTPEMADYIKSIQHGWSVFWCPKYNFPETSLQVICEDRFLKLNQIRNLGEQFFSRRDIGIAENILPFTEVVKKFKGDRYGEEKGKRVFGAEQEETWELVVPEDAHYVCQLDLSRHDYRDLKTSFKERNA